MNRNDWEAWKIAKGNSKKLLLAKMVSDNEALARSYVASFSRGTAYYTEHLNDDLLQAARIGLVRAIQAWRPADGSFSNCAFHWTRYEMQLVVRHATELSVPRSAFLPRAKQDEAAAFYAKHGRDPQPHEIGLTEQAIERHRKAMVECVPLQNHDVDDESLESQDPTESAESVVDHKRDAESLRVFLAELTKRDRKEFWSGTRSDLVEQAKRFIEGRRSCRTKK